MSNVGEILQYARDTRIAYDHLGLQSMRKAIAVQIAMPVTDKWFRFRGVRRQVTDGQPIALTEAYVIADLASAVAEMLPPADAADQPISPGSNTLFQFIGNAAGLSMSRVTQDIQAVPASAEVATALDIPRRSACLRILPCYHDQDGRMFGMSVSHHPGDSFAYLMHIEVEAEATANFARPRRGASVGCHSGSEAKPSARTLRDSSARPAASSSLTNGTSIVGKLASVQAMMSCPRATCAISLAFSTPARTGCCWQRIAFYPRPLW